MTRSTRTLFGPQDDELRLHCYNTLLHLIGFEVLQVLGIGFIINEEMALTGVNGLRLSINVCQRCCARLISMKNTYITQTRRDGNKFKNNLDGHRQGIIKKNSTKFIRYYSDRPVVNSTLDEEELKRFAKLAQSWWDETGEFAALHSMNKVRVPFIRDGLVYQREELSPDRTKPLQGLKIVDAGCGGGLLSEPLARLGAFVIGVDPVEESTQVAGYHLNEDPEILPRVKYITGTVEDLVGTEAESFDAVVSSEVMEHVADYMSFLESCCALVKPGGSIFLTTLNKTQMAKYLAVYGAENILGIVPKGTHDWEKFIPPDDLQSVLERNNFDVRAVHGLRLNPLTLQWSWVQDTSVNYAIHAVKLDLESAEEDSSSAEN